MNAIKTTGGGRHVSAADTALKYSAQFWFLVAAVGQLLFVYYVFAFYYEPTLHGNFAAWAKNERLPHGYVRGDTVGNLMFAGHVLLAAVMTVGGLMQLIPQIRARYPALHRWTGRVFLITAMALALGGLYMVWPGGRHSNVITAISVSFNAVLIITFAVVTWRYAVAKNFVLHRRWALRMFMVASGVWFIRVGYMAWILINQGPVGIKDGGGGWFDIACAFGSYLIPLAMLELYLRAREGESRNTKIGASIAIVIAALFTGVGAGGAYIAFWRPLL